MTVCSFPSFLPPHPPILTWCDFVDAGRETFLQPAHDREAEATVVVTQCHLNDVRIVAVVAMAVLREIID